MDIYRKIGFYSNQFEREKKYWLERLSGEIIRSSFPYDYDLPISGDGVNGKIIMDIDREILVALNRLTDNSNAKLYMVLNTVVVCLLYKYNGIKDIITGAPVSKQDIEGEFINTVLVFKNQVKSDMSFKELLLEVRKTIIEAEKNQNYPVEMLADQLGIKDNDGSFPLFDVAVLLRNIHDQKNIKHIDCNVTFLFERTETCVECVLEYNARLFRKEKMEGILRHLINILRAAINDIDIKMSDIDMLDPEEKHRLLYDFNNTQSEYPKDKTIHELFEEQVERTPGNTAVIFEDKQLTYRELNMKANQLARVLRDEGVKQDDIVAVMLERSLEMAVSLFAILKAGGAYLPVSPDYPEDRTKYIIEDSRTNILLTQGSLPDKVQFNINIINVEDGSSYMGDGSNIENLNKPNNLAYIIYTSGSTGKPKGTMIEHHSVINRLNWMQKMYPLCEHDVILQKTPFTFDVSVWELFWWSFVGAKVCFLIPGGEKDPEEIVRATQKNKITTMHFVPSMLNVFLEHLEGSSNVNKLSSLSQIFASGEALNLQQAERFNRILNSQFKTKLHNLYGPTEATVDVSYFGCSTGETLETIPIGKPIDNISLYVVDKNYEPQPVGVAGELCISGVGLARGYLNKLELTREKFVSNPFVPRTKMYRTGDLARWLPDGNIEFLGRIDHQVKIRGFRIELGEIEARLLGYEPVKEAVVVDREDKNSNKYLCAYIISDENVTIADIREHLSKNLPDYMIPSYFVQIGKMPLTPNGKLDRKALPDPGENINTGIEYAAPRNQVELRLTEIWKEILGIGRIGINHNFFELGGHSLKATILVLKMHKEMNVEVPLREVFKHPTIRGLAEYIEGAEQNIYASIQPAEEKEYYPLSSAQRRLYILNQLERESTSYNMPIIMAVEGAIDKERFEAVFKALIDRHEALRTSFEIVEGEAVQRVHKDISFKLSYIETGEDKIDSIAEEFIKPFGLSEAPLLRIALARISEERYIFLFDMHHIISDGVSTNILIKEFISLYAGEKLPELRIQYKDFSAWQNELFKTEAIKKQEEYWLNSFRGELPVLNMPLDYSRPVVQSFEGDSIDFTVDSKLTEELNRIASETGATLYMLLLAAYNVLLSKYTGQEDIVVGSPVAGRQHMDLDNIIGMFINTLAMRNHPGQDKTFKGFLLEVKDCALSAYENQDYPFEELVEKLDLQRDVSRNPLFDTMFSLQNTDDTILTLDGLSFIPYGTGNRTAKFDLSLDAVENEDGIGFSLEYCTKLFRRETVQRVINHFVNILKEIVKNPGVSLYQIDMLSEEEKRQLLFEFNNTKADYPKDKTVHELFEEQVEKTPDSIAVVFEGRQLSYKELNEKANQLARVLRGNGVGAEKIVGIMARRSEKALVGLFAVLKAGGAYLPIDPEYPEERINYMLEDSGTYILLTQDKLNENIKFHGKIINIENKENYSEDGTNLTNINIPTDLAYLIYTSGTTGKPKGVMVENRSFVNISFAWKRKYNLNHTHIRLLQMASFSFDVFAADVSRALLNGGQLIVCPSGTKFDFPSLYILIKKYGISIFDSTPALIIEFMDYIYQNKLDIGSLKLLIIGSDVCHAEDFRRITSRFGSSMRIVNCYGVTEATIDSSYYEGALEDIPISGSVPIGKPLQNIKFYVLDKYLSLQPSGICGELFIGGEGVARGYLNRPELDKHKFIKNPFVPGERMYRTGDLARWLPDGNIEFLGRIDQQVKIRGYRIELGEIESRLLGHEQVKEAAVADREDKDGSKYLCAYIVSDESIEVSGLREYLSKSLPGYMIPSYFVQLDKLPLNPNGKIDPKALPEPDRVDTGIEYINPRNKVEEKLVEVWSEVLGVKMIGVNHNFFELGGDSIKAIKVVSKLALHYKINANDIFENQTISSLARKLNEFDILEAIKKIPQTISNTDNAANENLQEEKKEYQLEMQAYQNSNVKYKDIKLTAVKQYQNIVLCGSTGYLGVYLLKDLLESTNANIFLLIRGDSVQNSGQRLKQKLDFYFGSEMYEINKQRITVLNGDIAKDNLGLPEAAYYDLSNKVECIINSAANVKHYGRYEEFHSANVAGTRNILKFALDCREKDYNHISTVSVASGSISNRKHVYFTEDDCDVGQDSSNYYVKTKHESEKLVLEARTKGINCNIFMVGNLVFNSTNGKFQENISDSNFYKIIKSYIKVSAFPDIGDENIDFSFIDHVSRAIALLFNKENIQNETYHVINNRYTSIAQIGELIRKTKPVGKLLEPLEFLNYLGEEYKKGKGIVYIENILFQYTSEENEDFTKFTVATDRTNLLLNRMGFEWIKLNVEHVSKMIGYCEKVGFL